MHDVGDVGLIKGRKASSRATAAGPSQRWERLWVSGSVNVTLD